MDKIIKDSIGLLEDAIICLKKGMKYDGKLPYEAKFPNGAADHIRMIFEPISRLDATNERDKAIDTLAYSANYLSWMREGCPKSEFAWMMNRYLSLFKIQESRIKLNQEEKEIALPGMRRDENGSNGGGFGTVSEVQRDG